MGLLHHVPGRSLDHLETYLLIRQIGIIKSTPPVAEGESRLVMRFGRDNPLMLLKMRGSVGPAWSRGPESLGSLSHRVWLSVGRSYTPLGTSCSPGAGLLLRT